MQRRDLVDSSYTNAFRGRAEVRGYRSLQGYFDVVRDIVRRHDSCFVYAYWPQLDAMCHGFGADHDRSRCTGRHECSLDSKQLGNLLTDPALELLEVDEALRRCVPCGTPWSGSSATRTPSR